MRLKASHVVAACLALLALAVVLTLIYDSGARSSGADPDAFLAEVRELRESGRGSTEGTVASIDAPADARPDIEIEGTVFDLGTIPNDQITTKPLLVHNRGNAPLKIIRLQTSCACTTADMKEMTVPAGESRPIDVGIEPRRVPGFYSEKTLTISSNDPDEATLELQVTARIEPELEMSPETIDFGTVSKGTAVSETIHLRQLQEERFEIADVNTIGSATEDPGGIRVQWRQVPESAWQQPGKPEYTIDVELSPDAPSGELFRNVYIDSNLKRIRRLRVPVRAVVESPLTVSPSEPVVLRADAQGNAEAVARLAGTVPMELIAVDFNAEELLVTSRLEQEAKELVLDIGFAPDVPPGRIDDTIRVTVRIGDQTVTEAVHVRGYMPDLRTTS